MTSIRLNFGVFTTFRMIRFLVTWGKELERVCPNSPGRMLGCGRAWPLARLLRLSAEHGPNFPAHLLPCTWTKPVLPSLASGTDRKMDLAAVPDEKSPWDKLT